MKRYQKLTFQGLLTTLLLTSCGLTGYGPTALPDGALTLASARTITPRTKGGTLTITPQTKGGTLLGHVVWPTEVKALSSRRFDLNVYFEDVLVNAGSTDSEGGFILNDVPAQGELRIEASVPGHPYVVLRRLIDTSSVQLAETVHPPQDLSMLTTAATALLLDARSQSPKWQQITPQRLMQTDILATLQPLAQQMTPLLDSLLTKPMEQQPGMSEALTQARLKLEPALNLLL